MTVNLRAWWQKIRKPLGIIGIIAACIAVVVLVFIEVRLYGTGFVGKTLWDWLGLVAALAIPAVVGLGAAWYSAQQGKVSDRENTDNQHEVALQAYIDKMSKLLLKEHLGERTENGELKPEYEQVRNIARVRTITVLIQLDARRIGYVFAFLREAGLMSTTSKYFPKTKTSKDDVMSLSGADLHAVNWSKANLYAANLSAANLKEANLNEANLIYATLTKTVLHGAHLSKSMLRYTNLSRASLYKADLSGADLMLADLSGADFWEANLKGANLNEANLSLISSVGANLSKANLYGADLSRAGLSKANLSAANLGKANLSKADLRGADLSRATLLKANLLGVDLSRANLKGAFHVTVEELETQAASLKGATMPDGSKHP